MGAAASSAAEQEVKTLEESRAAASRLTLPLPPRMPEGSVDVVRRWSTTEVFAHMEHLGRGIEADGGAAQLFRDANVDGRALLRLCDEAKLKGMGIRSSMQRKIILAELGKLLSSAPPDFDVG